MLLLRRGFGQQPGSRWTSRSPARPLRQKGREGSAGGARGGTCRPSMRNEGGGSAPASLRSRTQAILTKQLPWEPISPGGRGPLFPRRSGRSSGEKQASGTDSRRLPPAESGAEADAAPGGLARLGRDTPPRRAPEARRPQGPHHAPSALTVTQRAAGYYRNHPSPRGRRECRPDAEPRSSLPRDPSEVPGQGAARLPQSRRGHSRGWVFGGHEASDT